MIKNLIAPIQAWLLSQGRCVACGKYLNKGQEKKVGNNITVTCNCGRIFIKEIKDKKVIYRRALFSEI